MTRRTIPLLTVFLLAAEFLVFSVPEKPDGSVKTEPAPPKSHYFQESGAQVDNIVDRIRFKIAYSWDKAWEYFRLAGSSVTDAVPAKARDADSRIRLKTGELVEQGRQAVRETADRTVKDLTEKGREIRNDLGKAGEDLKTEAEKQLRENADQMLK